MMIPLTLIAFLLVAVYSGLIFAYRFAWKAIPFYMPGHTGNTTITVLIPARNEEANIVECLRSLARQSYPRSRFEVIVLDDHSTDGTVAAVQAFAGELRLRCLSMTSVPSAGSSNAYKKFAIGTGVSEAEGELIVTTDADCTFDPRWLATIASFYESKGAQFIAAPVRIGAQAGSPPARAVLPHSLLGIFQTLDFITLQGITGAAVHSGLHSMCNGANLAYTRAAFNAAGGYRDIDSIPSGDDMLLMHKIYRLYPERVFFLKSRHAVVTTRPETSWKGFVHQRVRWASKADRYEDRRIFWALLLVYVVNVAFVALLIGGFFHPWWLGVFLVLLMLKTFVEYPFVREVAAFFGQQRLMAYFPVLQPLHVCYTVVIGWMGKFGSYRWKDRKISK
jgi:poly-beta-1,6-N-acetyl-D-glucosamine synthase